MRPVRVLIPISLASAAWGVPVCSGSTSSYVATSWYTGWHSQYLPIANISWSKYSAMSYAFACVSSLSVCPILLDDLTSQNSLTTQDASVIGLEDSDLELLPQFVEAAHANVCHIIWSYC